MVVLSRERRRVVPALVDVVGDGLALLDHQGCFLGLNPPAVEVLGRPEAELAGQLAPFAISSDPPPAPGSRTTTWTGSGGRRRDLEYRVAPVPGVGHAVWFSDVTTVRRQQERLRAIVRAAASVAGAGSLRATLDAVAREVAMTANIAAVQILAIDDPREEVRVLGMAGFGDAAGFTTASACRRWGPTSASSTHWSAGSRGGPHRKPVIWPPRLGPAARDHGSPTGRFVSMPL